MHCNKPLQNYYVLIVYYVAPGKKDKDKTQKPKPL